MAGYGAVRSAAGAGRATYGSRQMTVFWLRRVIGADGEGWSGHARDSILYANDGIVTAAGLAEGFATAGASTGTLLFLGAAVIVAGGLAAGGAQYAEKRTEWEMHRSLLEAERASIEADPHAEFEELALIYETKGLSPDLARQVGESLTEHDPVAAHADAELHLDTSESPLTSVRAALSAGLSYTLGAIVPLV